MKDPLEFLYYLGYRAKTAYDSAQCQRLPARVISIGNITTGGTGKTPATVALALEARKRGFQPCVLTRGYGGKMPGPFVVSEEMYVEDVGDEPMLMARHLVGIPIIKGANRYESGMFAIENLHFKPDLFILDDGFQHRKLARDLDVVLINTRDPFFNRKLLPMGRLREPLTELKRADVIMFSKCNTLEMPEGLHDDVRRFNDSAPFFISRHRPSFVMDSSDVRQPINWLQGKTVFAFAGIGEPIFFMETLEGAGAKVASYRKYRDHYRFEPKDVSKIKSLAADAGAEFIITTEKDIMRMRRFSDELENFFYLGVEFEADMEFYDQVLGPGALSEAGAYVKED